MGDVALSSTPLAELRLSECLVASAAEDWHYIPSESAFVLATEQEGPGLWARGQALPPATCSHSRWRALVGALGRAHLSLLDLSWNDIGPAAVSALAMALAETASLGTLDVSGCRLEALCCEGLCAGLERNSTVTALGMSCNKVCDGGTTRVAEVLAVNTTLRRLCLASNQIRSEGVGELAKSLARNSTLTHLGLDGHRLDTASAGALAHLLASNSTLASLSLQPDQDCPMAEGCEEERGSGEEERAGRG